VSLATSIRRALPVLAEHGGIDRTLLRVRLVRAGLSRWEAVAAMRFIPLALGRSILLEGLGIALPDSYLLVNGDAREERKLAGEPFFRGTAFIARTLAADYGPSLLGQVALLSPEVQAVNEALNAGSQPQDLVASPPVVLWEAGIDDVPAKPWWKFWA
jgi:hypothetical protein